MTPSNDGQMQSGERGGLTAEQSKKLNRLFRESRAKTREWVMAMIDHPNSEKSAAAAEADDESLIEFSAYVHSLLEEPKR
jgi:hypothetical protein